MRKFKAAAGRPWENHHDFDNLIAHERHVQVQEQEHVQAFKAKILEISLTTGPFQTVTHLIFISPFQG
jgi:hypothetical protein